MAGGKSCDLPAFRQRSTDRHWVINGRLVGAVAGSRIGRTKERGARSGHGPDRAGGRLHRGTDVETVLRGDQKRDRAKGLLAEALCVWRRALSDHSRAHRRGPQTSVAWWTDRNTLPGPYPAGRAGPRRD